MITNWKKIFVKYLVNYWKITGKRLETEQNGLIDFDISGAYFYLGALKPPVFAKFGIFSPKMTFRRGFPLTTAAGSHRQQKGRQPGTHGGSLWGWRPASVVSK